MGLLQRVSSVAAPARPMRATAMSDYVAAFWGGEEGPWLASLSAAGVQVTPELTLTLSAMYCGVTTITYDLATLPCQLFKLRDDGGKDRVRGGSFSAAGGIGSLAYKLRWQPNTWQTAAEYFCGMIPQFLLRGRAYAEIRPGPSGAVDQLLPRHPDRITPERLPSGRLRYRLAEFNAPPRYLTDQEIFVVRDFSMDGINSLGRSVYGANAIGSALAAEAAAARFFKSGMTAAAIATYKGPQAEDDWEAALHRSITRYAAGLENNFGLLLVPDDVTIQNLGVEPEKAQMMLAREWGAREVARVLRLPGHKLNIPGSQAYNSQVQAALEYVISCLRPIAVMFEQAIQRDLVLAKDDYVAEFKLEALLRGDFETQANYLEKLIRNRIMRPSEARLILNMNPDTELDRLSERDFQPGRPATLAWQGIELRKDAGEPLPDGRAMLKATLALHENALRCLRRERVAVEKLARKHADDPAGWRTALQEFFSEHAGFIGRTMRLHPTVARAYAAQHGTEWALKGLRLLGTNEDGPTDWERWEADELAALALEDDNSIDHWLARRSAITNQEEAIQ